MMKQIFRNSALSLLRPHPGRKIPGVCFFCIIMSERMRAGIAFTDLLACFLYLIYITLIPDQMEIARTAVDFPELIAQMLRDLIVFKTPAGFTVDI